MGKYRVSHSNAETSIEDGESFLGLHAVCSRLNDQQAEIERLMDELQQCKQRLVDELKDRFQRAQMTAADSLHKLILEGTFDGQVNDADFLWEVPHEGDSRD